MAKDHDRATRYVGHRTEDGVSVLKEGPDGRMMPLPMRHDLRNHSPTGAEWGYTGSGPAQLALAILSDAVGEEAALRHYQDFKFAIISRLPHDQWQLPRSDVMAWHESHRLRAGDGVEIVKSSLPTPSAIIDGTEMGERAQRGEYQVWYDKAWPENTIHEIAAGAIATSFPDDFEHVGNVRANGLEEALKRAADLTAPGATTAGDVIVDPAGKAHRITPDGFAEIDQAKEWAPADEPPLERVERQLRDWKHDHSREFAPDPASGRIGSGTHRWADDAWGVMPEAGKLRVVEGVPDWSGVDDRSKQTILAREVDFSGITRDQLNAVYEEIGFDEIDECQWTRIVTRLVNPNCYEV